MTPGRPAVLLDTPQGSIPLRYTIERIPDAPDPQVAATIARMIQYVNEDAQSAPIQYDAQCAAAIDPSNVLAGVHSFVRSRMRFKKDEEIAQPFSGALPTGGTFVEALTRPVDVSLQYAATGQAIDGDCDCHSMYCAALLKALGIECCFATLGADANDPSVYSHVYVCAYWRGQRVPLDCSHKSQAGIEEPNRYGKYMEWPIHDRSSWGAIGVGALLLGWFAWKNRDEIRRLLA